MGIEVTGKKTVAVVGTNGLPANYGGWETLVDHLTLNLRDDVDFIVYCSSTAYDKKLPTCNGAKLVYLPINANGIQSIFYDIVSMIHALFIANTMLILGVSGCIFLPVIRLISRKRLIVNIDGIEWKRDKWGRYAKWFLRLSEKIAVKYAHDVVTDNIEIANYVKQEYGVDSSVIAYGGDHAEKIAINPASSNQLIDDYPFLNGKYAFGVCRVEPENNLHVILKAYEGFSKYPLVIVGNWNNSDYGESLKKKYKSVDHIFLIDAIYDQKKLNILRSNSYVYLHGHSVGGTNPSLVEAMHLELPIIAFDVCYNRATTANKALYFSNETELLSVLNESSCGDYEILSKDMSSLATSNYRWGVIAEAYNNLIYKEDGQVLSGNT